MRMSYTYSALVLSAILVLCSVCQAEFEEFDDLAHLPPWAARGFRRELLQGAAKVVTVGYSPKAQFPVNKTSRNALPILQNALNQVGKNGGGTLLIGAGTFIVNGQLTIPRSNIRIQGAGREKTILRLAVNATKWNGTGMITGRNLARITVSRLTLDGNRNNQPVDEVQSYGRYGLFISPHEELYLNQIAVINFQRYGIDPPARNVQPGVDYTGSKKLTISVTNCIASFNNYDGFIFDTVVGLYAANNTAEGNGRYGFNLCTGTWNAIVENNIIKNNGYGAKEPNFVFMGGNGCGVMTDTNDYNGNTYVSTNVLYRNNQVIGSKRGGFCGKLGKNVRMLNNVIFNATQCAWLSRMNGVEFTGNTCTKTNSYIINDGNMNATISNNTCDGAACK